MLFTLYKYFILYKQGCCERAFSQLYSVKIPFVVPGLRTFGSIFVDEIEQIMDQEYPQN